MIDNLAMLGNNYHSIIDKELLVKHLSRERQIYVDDMNELPSLEEIKEIVLDSIFRQIENAIQEQLEGITIDDLEPLKEESDGDY